jgi:hypothetical protein
MSPGLPHPFLSRLEAPLIDHTPRRYSTMIRNQLAGCRKVRSSLLWAVCNTVR